MDIVRGLILVLCCWSFEAWAILVTENAQFRLYYATTVSYVTMDGTTHASLNLQAGVYRCGNDLFGGVDPAYGKVKACSYPDQIAGQCPVGYVWDEPSLSCKEGQPLDQVCASQSGKESIADGVQWVVEGTQLTTRYCDGGCEARGSFAASGGDKAVWITGPGYFTGKSCVSAQQSNPSEPIPDKSQNQPAMRCVLGQCPGYINGLWTCQKCSSTLSTSTSSSSSSTTNKDSTGATTGTTTTNTTTTSSTTCSGSTCTTTTTNETKNPDGTTSTTSSSSSQPKDTFCTQNPKAAACVVGAWGGSCTAGFTCDGDAVQCAIARENHKRNCELFENETADSQQGKAVANGQARPEGHPGNSPETVNVSGNIDQTNPYGGSCPPDINLSVYGKTVTIPVSNACDIFKWMGYIAVAFTMYAAARITMSGVSA